jgi:hypothetical protein
MVDHVRLGHLGRGDVVKAIGRAPGAELTVLEAGQTQLVVTYPDETLHDAIGNLLRHDIGRLPVVSREEPKRVVGYSAGPEFLPHDDVLTKRKQCGNEA